MENQDVEQQIYDKIVLIRRELLNTDTIKVEQFGLDAMEMKTLFASTVEIQEYLNEFEGVFFSGQGLVFY